MADELLMQVRNHLSAKLRFPPEVVERMLTLARRNLSANIHEASACVAAGDLERAWKAVHSLKGNLANIGLSGLAREAYNIETDIRSSGLESVRRRLTSLEAQLRPLLRSE